MKFTFRSFSLLAVLLVSSFTSSLFAQCGVERESVKTGTDPDAHLVNLNSSTSTTIASMQAFATPNPIPANNRVSPAETTVWVINATMTLFKLESDSDYHIVIQDASGNTMITEIPAPSCVGSTSPFLADITNARANFDAHFTATTSFTSVSVPVQVTGVGMFDFPHGQTGAAPNQIELHPVLSIVFNPGQNPDFSLGASPTSLSVAQGASASSTISTAVMNGFNSAVNLSISGLPSGVTASFNPASIAAPGSGNSTLKFTASSTATTGASTVTITATGGGVTHTATVALNVTAAAAADFSVTASPASLAVAQGGSASSTIATSVTGGFNSALSLSVSGLPSGVTATFNPTSLATPDGGRSTLALTASSTAAAGTSNLTVTATGGGVTHTATVALTVTRNSILGITPPDHVVIVMEENHSFANIIGSSSAPFINSLAQQGALFTQSFAVEHPSQPNYLDLFSGSNQGVTDDSCPHTFTVENLASELTAAGLTFTGFSEDLPGVGSTVCTSGAYARKHAPWINFSNIATASNQPFTAFPTDFTTLPTISFVIPNLNDDMHDGTIAQGDAFLQQNLSSYIQFAQTHNSLLIVTWDEDDNSSSNQIPTIFVGPMVKTGQFSEKINHFNVLRTLEDLYGLTHVGSAANATAISDVWQQVVANFMVSASPASLSVTQGSSASSTIATTISGGFNSSVSLSVSGLPSGVTASFSPASIGAPGSGSSTLTFTTSSTATAGTANVTVTATGGGLTRTTTVALTVNAAATPTFTVSASPASVSVVQGASGSSTITTTVSGGFNSAVALTVSALPTGVTASFNPASIAAPGSGSSTLTLTASSTATTGTVNLVVTATGGGVTQTTSVSLTVVAAATPAFAVTASPTSLSIAQGSSGSSTISTSVSGGFNAAVSLSASGLPSGVTASFSPASIAAPGSGNSTLTFTASSTAATGTTNVTVTASGGGITHTVTVSLTITATGGGGGTTTTQLLGNPGFENGSNPAPWTLTSTHTPQEIINSSNLEPPHSGKFDAWLDGFGTTTTDTVMQQVTIPSNATAATLAFFLHIDTAETSTTRAFDTLTVQVRNSSGTVLSTLDTFSNLNAASGYQQHSYDLSSFAGQTIQIFFQGKEDFELQTSFVLDDVTLNATVPGSSPAPTVQITSPANGATISGNVTITATASDSAGITQIQLFVDGNIVSSNTNANSLSWQFATTSVSNGTHQIMAQATDAAGITGVSPTITVTVANGSGTVSELIGNGGFENGAANPSPWVLTSTHSPLEIVNSSNQEPAHSGNFDAWLDGWGTTTTDTVMQQVSIPANATAATLSFWLHIDTAETSTTKAFDTLTVQVRDSSGNVLSTLATFSNLNAASGYQQHTYDLSSFKGQTIQIFMTGAEDFEFQTSFVLDDISLQVK